MILYLIVCQYNFILLAAKRYTLIKISNKMTKYFNEKEFVHFSYSYNFVYINIPIFYHNNIALHIVYYASANFEQFVIT